MISENFKEILDNFEEIKENQKFKGNKFASKIRNDFKNEIMEFIKTFTDGRLYRVKGFPGRVNWTKNKVQFRIGNNNSSRTFEKGLYLYYSFDTKNKCVYLSLVQGDDYPDSEIRIEIAKRLVSLIDFDVPPGFIMGYFEGEPFEEVIFSKCYHYEELDESLIKEDLKEVILIFEQLIPKYIDILDDLNLNSLIEDIGIDKDNLEKYEAINDDGNTVSYLEEYQTRISAKLDKLNRINFLEYLSDRGYLFNKQLIENYLLSLKVKPFVILTGNSGTGKTKLSQLFAKFLNSDLITIKPQEDYVTVRGKINYSSWSNMGWTLEKDYFRDFLPIDEFESKCDLLVDNIHAKGSISLTIQLEYTNIVLKDHLEKICENLGIKKYSKIEYPLDILINVEGIKKLMEDPLPFKDSISLTQNSNKSAYDDCQWNMDHNFFKYSPFKKGKMDCKIVVDGIYSEAKIRVLSKLTFSRNKELQDYLRKHDGDKVNIELKLDDFNFEKFKPKWNFVDSINIRSNLIGNSIDKYIIVPVGANWTDNSNILGYHNVIINDYQPTPTYDLIKNAKINLLDPYFLILDEMNLSHVERYFADFLSAIESGEKIPLYGNDNELTIPSNLFIIGTVNVDETTYMFSPKVLDRANTIEFDILSALEYMSSELNDDNFEGDINYLQSPLEDSDISNLNIIGLKEKLGGIGCEEGILWEVLSHELAEFQNALKGSGFDFGFRVINEILRFMVVAWRYENSPDEWDNWERYFDAQIKQKILPKLHGSEKAIGNVLTNLFNICLVDRNNNENPKNFNVTKGNSRYYTSALKLQNMAKVLSERRYVSFIN